LHLLQLVEHAEDVDGAALVDVREVEEEIEHGPAGKADEIAAEVERRERVAHAGDDLGVGDLRFSADGVEIELRELAEASQPRLVVSPDGGDLVAAEGTRQVV